MPRKKNRRKEIQKAKRAAQPKPKRQVGVIAHETTIYLLPPACRSQPVARLSVLLFPASGSPRICLALSPIYTEFAPMKEQIITLLDLFMPV
jgi:hypothetical protein